jgi:hypothetical protein
MPTLDLERLGLVDLSNDKEALTQITGGRTKSLYLVNQSQTDGVFATALEASSGTVTVLDPQTQRPYPARLVPSNNRPPQRTDTYGSNPRGFFQTSIIDWGSSSADIVVAPGVFR